MATPDGSSLPSVVAPGEDEDDDERRTQSGGSGRHGLKPVLDAIVKGQRDLLQACTETGAWRVHCDGGPATTGMVVVALRFMDELDDATAESCCRYLIQCQLDGGGFPAHPVARSGDVSTTALCLAGLHATGLRWAGDAIERARAFLDQHGGDAALVELARGGDLGALALALAGAFDPAALPRPPRFLELAPGVSEAVLEQRFAFVIPFRALISEVLVTHLQHRATWRLPAPTRDRLAAGSQALAERVARGIETASDRGAAAVAEISRRGARLLGQAARKGGRLVGDLTERGPDPARTLTEGLRGGPKRLFGAMARGALQAAAAMSTGAQEVAAVFQETRPALLDRGRSVLRSAQGMRLELYLRRFHNADGSWLYGDAIHTALALAALSALEVPHTDPRITDGLRWLHGQKVAVSRSAERFEIFSTDVWPTCFALRALLATGVPATDPVVARALNWLISIQRDGSWAFQGGNTTTPDCDDTAVALASLALARTGLAARRVRGEYVSEHLLDRCDRAISAARGWLASRQNADGGWASYQPGLPSKPPGPIMTAPPVPPDDSHAAVMKSLLHPIPDLGDPATEDVTARVLFALGKVGVTVADRQVARAVAFLRSQQAEHGGFWGRWVVNFVAGTAWVLRGLAAVGAPRQDWMDRAIGFLLEHQNADGGWGETAESYRDPGLAGQGESNPCLTGLVVSALIEIGGDPDAVGAGVDYLLTHFQARGWNTERRHLLHALFPPSLFYTLPLTERVQPMEALGLFTSMHDEQRRPTTLTVTDDALDLPRALHPDFLDRLATIGDEPADGVIRALRETGSFDQVNAVLRHLQSNLDLPERGSVPDAVVEFFATTGPGLERLDRERIERAQELFERCGWGVGTVLFCSSLPQCYAFPEGAKVLLSTQGFAANARRRLVETAQLVFDVASPGGFTAEGRGIRTAQKVRLMHAAIRSLVGRNASLLPGRVPLSQQELLGTLMTFSVVVVDGLRGLGFQVDDDDAEAWFYLWRVVGTILGIPPENIPADVAGGEALFDHMRTRYWRASLEGQTLARLTLDVVHEMIPGEQFDNIPDALIRHLAGDHCAELLAVPRSDWEPIIKAARWLDRLRWEALGFASPLAALLRHASFTMLQALAQQQREGKNINFTIPSALQRRWEIEFRRGPRP